MNQTSVVASAPALRDDVYMITSATSSDLFRVPSIFAENLFLSTPSRACFADGVRVDDVAPTDAELCAIDAESAIRPDLVANVATIIARRPAIVADLDDIRAAHNMNRACGVTYSRSYFA